MPHRAFDPSLLDAIEESVVEWSGMVYSNPGQLLLKLIT